MNPASFACLACGSGYLRAAADLGSSPVLTGALFPDRRSARRAVQGPLTLGACRRCGHVQNTSFDPDLVQYDVSYDNSLHFSPTFQQYADALVARLVRDHDLHGKHLVEVGAGKGDFLAAMCAAGGNTGTGYDPTVESGTSFPGVTFVQDYFRPGQQMEDYDLLICRHVLEHLEDPAALLASLRGAAPQGALYYFEVPAAEFNFGPDGLWDCIYPHVSYFSVTSLRALLQRCGFEILHLSRSFHGQFISAEARPGNPVDRVSTDVSDHLRRVTAFAGRWETAVQRWQREVARRQRHGQTVALWGAGSKGVNFLNAVDPDGTMPVIDRNPRKFGYFLPGSGHRVQAPDALPDTRVSTVVVTNPAYENEIAGELAELGLAADVMVV